MSRRRTVLAPTEASRSRPLVLKPIVDSGEIPTGTRAAAPRSAPGGDAGRDRRARDPAGRRHDHRGRGGDRFVAPAHGLEAAPDRGHGRSGPRASSSAIVLLVVTRASPSKDAPTAGSATRATGPSRPSSPPPAASATRRRLDARDALGVFHGTTPRLRRRRLRPRRCGPRRRRPLRRRRPASGRSSRRLRPPRPAPRQGELQPAVRVRRERQQAMEARMPVTLRVDRGEARRASPRPRVRRRSARGARAAADPTKDQCIDANETAQALRKSEKLHDAEQRLIVCVSASCPGPVRDDCAQRLTELRSLIPTIVFSVKDDADQDLSDVHVTMDDQPLTSKLDGTAIAIDPGPHHFVFEAAGRQKEERSLVIREGEKDRHERVVLVAQAGAAPVAAAPVPESAPPASVEASGEGRKAQRIGGPRGRRRRRGRGRRRRRLRDRLEVDVRQRASRQCTQRTRPTAARGESTDGNTAHSQATVSTVAFIAGGALLATGALLVFTAPRGVTVSPTVGLRSRRRGRQRELLTMRSSRSRLHRPSPRRGRVLRRRAGPLRGRRGAGARRDAPVPEAAPAEMEAESPVDATW